MGCEVVIGWSSGCWDTDPNRTELKFLSLSLSDGTPLPRLTMSTAPGLLRQELSCPLCLQLFDAPVTAECGHSFCRACLIRVAGEPAADGTVACPCCQASTRPQALSTNLQLARLVERLAQVPQGHCEEHLDPLSIYCEQDRTLVCGVCASLGSHRGHRLLPAAEAHARLKVLDQ